MRNLITAVAATVGLLAATSTASAQHRHGHHRVHVPVHHGIHYGHHNWHHVVPHRPTYVGAYYTVGHNHYYTPSPIVPILTVASNPAAPPPAVVEAQKPVELTFGSFRYYEDLAGRLAFEANALCLDLYYNYKHNKNFDEVYREAYGVLQAAQYVHGKEHRGDRAEIGKRMVEVDRLFHHVQEEARGWTRAAAKQIGTDALPEKTSGVEAILHHLCFDVGVKPHEQPAEAAPPPGSPTEIAPPPRPVRNP